MSTFVYRYCNQGEIWFPRDGKPVRISDMDESWRANARRFIERRAAMIELQYSLGEMAILAKPIEAFSYYQNTWVTTDSFPSGDAAMDAFENEMESRADDPVAWLRTTTLYRALENGS